MTEPGVIRCDQFLSHPPARVWQALTDPELHAKWWAAGELAGHFALSRPAVSEHLAVLRHAGLVREEPRGRHRYYHLAAEPLADVQQWLHPFERYWRDRLVALRDLVEEEENR